MKLKLITPNKGLEIDREVTLVEAESPEGSFGILDKHIGLVTTLKETSILRYQTKSTSPIKDVRLTDGILEVTQIKNVTEVRVIASKVEKLAQ
jgi:F0F1-type ATP synthase epsilon subunit